MGNLSLKKKILLQVLTICLTLSLISGFVLFRSSRVAQLYQSIATQNLPKVELLGSLLAKFRQIRIEVRSLGLVGNSLADNQRFSEATQAAVTDFLATKKELAAYEFEAQGKELFSTFDSQWEDFHRFGLELLELAEKGDEASLHKMTELVREVCPQKSQAVTNSLIELIDYQRKLSEQTVTRALSDEADTKFIATLALVIGFCFSLGLGYLFASFVGNRLGRSIKILSQEASVIDKSSGQIAQVAGSLSAAAAQQAAGLQHTVSAVNEISAMIEKNADNASASSENSQSSTRAASKGKEKVNLMLESIRDISEGNEQLIIQIMKSNEDISKVVDVINEIASKTKVINDIVFQTKLLSFNASVEAARAGENGKGFAVVAEEVGNLASMSGQAATEISVMLEESTKKVSEIVRSTTTLMDGLIKQSRSKVEAGTFLAKECAEGLDEILLNVSSVNEMLLEISTASREQSQGVREVNKAINELDSVTQANSSIAQESAQTADALKDQARQLNELVHSLTELVEGKKAVDSGLDLSQWRTLET